MLLLSRKPLPPLDAFIEYLWFLSDSPPHARERIVASGTIELVIDLRSDEFRIYDPLRPDVPARFSGAVVSGPYGRCFVADTRQHASILGVHFKPGGAFPFLGVSAAELSDAHVDLRALWGRRADELREQLCETPSPEAKFRLVERALISRLHPRRGRHPAVALALAAFGRDEVAPAVGEIIRRAGISHRRFVEVFTAEVGMTPKLFSRVRRFQRAITLLKSATRPSWSELALTSGYFDQSHLIRDFRAFSGVSPTEYARQLIEQVKENHLPIGE